MYLHELEPEQKFKFSERQEVRLTTWTPQTTEVEMLGRSVTGEVIKQNSASVRVRLEYRDKDRKPATYALEFAKNEMVQVELI